jgi:hypothetical protein
VEVPPSNKTERRSILYQKLVQQFTEQLRLKQPPIGLAFVEDVPAGVPHSTTGVPSACTFWRMAEQGVELLKPEDIEIPI